ncbi:tripartite tricarboxylate transporter TctB family protein [Paracoccus pacificus]|uniref:Tripartite tricarboxylate transporter TctB family protein n=1 Tax=Paracoccus pacificus TaxID=1463598 RepID=A0ABW4R4A6_9RHOB
MQLSDRLLGPGLVIFGVVVIYAAARLPSVPGVRFGADLMPIICGGALILFGAAITKSGLREHGPLISVDEWDVPMRQRVAALWSVLGLVAGIYLFQPLGFPLFGMIFMAGLMYLMNARPLTILVVAPVFVIGLHLAFTRLMYVDLPAGPLQGIL